MSNNANLKYEKIMENKTPIKRNKTMKLSKKQIQSRWCKAYSDLVCKSCPGLSGRIDWNTANHFFYTGLTPLIAAKKTINSTHNSTLN